MRPQEVACSHCQVRGVQPLSRIVGIRREGGNNMSSKITRREIRSHQGRAVHIKASSLSGASALSLAVLANLHAVPARAADAAGEDTALTEILVTAEKRSDNPRRVPTPLTPFTPQNADPRGITSPPNMTNSP